MKMRTALFAHLLLVSVAAAEPAEVLFDDCRSVEGWSLNMGREFPGAVGELGAATDGGRPCLAVSFDFTGGGNYGGAERPCSLPAISEMAFFIRVQGARRGMVRLRDATGQEHAAGFAVEGAGWQQIRLPVTPQRFGSHWSGANDGRFHFPLRRVLIAVQKPGRGRFLLRDLTVTTEDESLQWRVSVTTPVAGNVAFPQDLPLPVHIEIQNARRSPQRAALRARIARDDGQVLGEQTAELAFDGWQQRDHVVHLTGEEAGYYDIDVSLESGGRKAVQAEAGVVIVQPPVDLGRDDPDSFFGMHCNAPEAAARIGVKWSRQNRAWWWAEGRRGYFYWPDAPIDQARANGIRVMLTIHYAPPGWAKKLAPDEDSLWPPPPAVLAAWKEFVRACARRYRDKVDVFEIQNEPDLTLWRHPDLSFEQGVESYVRVTRAAVEVLRQEAPDHPIAGIDVSGGEYRTGLPFVRQVRRRLGDTFDIFTGHPYASPRYFGPGLRPWFPHENGLLEKVEASRRLLAEFGGRRRIWIGEKGWALARTAPALSADSRAFAACLAQALVTARASAAVEKFFWFTQQGANEKGYEYGLWRGSPPQPLPAAAAYAVTARMLRHARPRQALQLGDEVRAFAFQRGDAGIVAIWSTGEEMSVTAPESVPVTSWNLMGRRQGGARLILTQAPTFITTPASRLDDLVRYLERQPILAAQAVRVESLFIASLHRLVACVRNRTSNPVELTARLPGQTLKPRAPVASKPVEVALPLRDSLMTRNGKSLRVEILAGERSLWRGELGIELLPCPPADRPLHARLANLGPPAATVNKAAQILPPDPNIGWDGPSDLSARAWWFCDQTAFHLIVAARDDVHHVEAAGAGGFWKSDSLQFAFDMGNDASPASGYDDSDYELGCVLVENGPRVFMTIPETRELDLPCAATRTGDETIYRVSVPWLLLGGRLQSGSVFSFNFILNDNDGAGRAYWMGPRPGIGEGKRPGAFLDLVMP